MTKKKIKEQSKEVVQPVEPKPEPEQSTQIEDEYIEPDEIPEPGMVEITGKQADFLQEKLEAEIESKIPGSGYLFNIKEKFLPEASRLNDREIFSFAVEMTQREALYSEDPNFDVAYTFMIWVLRLRVSREGEGREEYNLARQAEAQKAEAEARGALGLGGI